MTDILPPPDDDRFAIDPMIALTAIMNELNLGLFIRVEPNDPLLIVSVQKCIELAAVAVKNGPMNPAEIITHRPVDRCRELYGITG